MCRRYTAASSSICSNLDGPQVINMPWPADIMRAWAGTAGIGPPRSRLLDLRHMPRCITGLSFCLHFAEPKIGSALVTRCYLPPFSLCFSFLSLLRSLFIAHSRIPMRRTIRSAPNPPPLSYPYLLRELERAVRCSFVFRHSPLHLRSALFLKDHYSQRSPRDRRRRRLVLQIDAAAPKAETSLVERHGNFDNARLYR